MQLGIVLVAFLDRSWEEALDATVEYGIKSIEPCSGGHIPKVHYDPRILISDAASRESFVSSIESRGLSVSALACHGNPLHPDRTRRENAHEDFVASCKLASLIGVDRVDVLSGCPAGGPHDRAPNWIINAIYPDFKNAYDWQWNESLLPYWRQAVRIADDHGVKICIEPHGGDMVYDTDTFLRLRNEVGPTIKATIDPSHLFWLGIDPVRMITELGDAVAFVHVKDVVFRAYDVARTGLLPSCDYDDWRRRSWTYCAVGYGHDELFWKTFVMALRSAGYDDVLAIEIEDSELTKADALRKSIQTMRQVMPIDPAPEANWFDAYKWDATDVE